MRKFKLKNELGQELDLNGKMFFGSPKGLGFSMSNKYSEIDGYFIKTSSKNKQAKRKGTITLLPPEAYTKYRALVDFITNAKELIFCYSIDTYWMEQGVEIESIDKGELNKWAGLECSVAFDTTTPIYESRELTKTIEGIEATQNKLYTYKYPYKYVNSTIAGEILVDPLGAQMDCDYSITIDGAMTSPIISVYEQDDEWRQIARVDLSAISLPDGESVTFRTTPNKAGAYLSDGTDITNSIGLQTTFPTFARLPQNKPLKFKISGTTAFSTRAKLSIQKNYRSI